MKQVKMMSLLSAFVVLLSAAACGNPYPPSRHPLRLEAPR